MAHWYRHGMGAGLLRLSGFCLVVLGWSGAGLLRRSIGPGFAGTVSITQFLVAAGLFISISAGMALLVVGQGLLAPVLLPPRWTQIMAPIDEQKKSRPEGRL
jgi:hypothetical protein